MNAYKGIGLMSGSSLDGLDIAYCAFTQESEKWSYKILKAETIAFDERWARRLANLAGQPAEAFARTDVFFGHWMGKAAKGFIQKNNIEPQFVASHGQTIFHQPDNRFTSQIGDGESIVSYLNCPVVTNFRNKNLAMGGQGAPLVPFGEQKLFRDHDYFLNLGGISNLSSGNLAFDVSPCNMVLNRLAGMVDENCKYDENGMMARGGEVKTDLLEALNALPYYQQRPPKSLGSEWVNESFWPALSAFPYEPVDKMRTVVEHVAFQIGECFRRMKSEPGTLLITGGGFLNIFLRERITQASSMYGVDVDQDVAREVVEFKEALIFAFLGLMTLLGKPNIAAHSTGIKDQMLGGAIHLPASGYRSLL